MRGRKPWFLERGALYWYVRNRIGLYRWLRSEGWSRRKSYRYGRF